MAMQLESRRNWSLGFALTSLLAFGACADVDAETSDALGADDLALEADADDAVADDVAEEDVYANEVLAQLFPSPNPSTGGDKGRGNGSDVVTIGDSWMNNTLLTGGAIDGALKRKGFRYQNYAVQGTELLQTTLFGPSIPVQYTNAKRQHRTLKTVIMTGGGNDILISGPIDCGLGGPLCTEKLGRIAAGLKTLWEQMARDGVEDVVYVGYAAEAGGGAAPARFKTPSTNGVGANCKAMTSLRCHFIETTDAVRRRFAIDGIHPTQAANDDLAALVIQMLTQQGIRR